MYKRQAIATKKAEERERLAAELSSSGNIKPTYTFMVEEDVKTLGLACKKNTSGIISSVDYSPGVTMSDAWKGGTGSRVLTG